ncbi:MAG: hypothetical protein MNPFHGCM_00346 [Gemmatimonadaceae bacterium]|nr:hypothetical protein [Gemmatimonadaceae bacterium]
MLTLLAFAVTAVAVYIGYSQSRRFVSSRLRYVDFINNPLIPIAAGIGAAVVAMPIVGLLPLVSTGTALSFGLSVGMGVAAGRAEIRRSLPPGI